jgi:hypothetical protein
MVNLSDSATAATWRIDAPARFVSEIFNTTDYQNVALIRAHSHGRRVVVIFVGVPRFARDSVIDYLVAWADWCARARVAAVVFCEHSFLHGFPLKYIGIVGSVATRRYCPTDRAAWCNRIHTPRAADRLFCQI